MRRLATSQEDKKVVGRIARNVSWIFSSQVVTSLGGLISMAAAARALGAESVAIVALVEAYMRLVSLFVHLEPWQAVIRFGSEALERGDTRRFRTLMGFSTAVDLVLGVASALIAFALAGLLAPWLKLEEHVGLLQIASLALAVSLRPTGMAMLRLFDRFDKLARLDAGMAIVRAISSVLLAVMGAGPAAFVGIIVVFSVASGALVYIAGRRVMADQLADGPADGPLQAIHDNPGLVRMFFNSNAAVILRQMTQRLDVILMATLVSPTAVGYYHIAKRSALAGLRLGRPLAQAIYPELARFAASRDEGRLSRYVYGVSGVFFLLIIVIVTPVLIWIEPLIVYVFTDDYRDAALTVGIQICASAVLLAGVAFVPALLSTDGDVALILIRLGVTILFFATFWPMTARFGAEGAAATHLLCNVVWLITTGLVLRASLARRATQTT
ncbi:oligosaccharide flippase family protein [uncultured Tateyamaria sp.]|uniref:lipopolysaccharide biosynthesis protein n=1 Tax=uncultured Tateyamaria sp. TaxID=455651 RepID=UPI0026308038|nr:oligosaccharide flippase family protein [uncultured Tateyamaria sp.]